MRNFKNNNMVNGNGVEDLETDGIKGWQEIRENKEKRTERAKPVEHLSFVYMLKTYHKKQQQTNQHKPSKLQCGRSFSIDECFKG